MSATETTLLSPADVTRETKPSAIFESRACSRCGGSGNFGPLQVMAGRCFKCNGSGRTLTKRGAAAREFYNAMISTPVEHIRPGDRLVAEGIPGITASKRVTVLAVEDNAVEAARGNKPSGGSIYRVSQLDKIEAAIERGATVLPYHDFDGERAVVAYEGLTLRCVSKGGEHHTMGLLAGSSKVVALDPEVLVAIRKTAAEYQESLTKTGKPRKGSRWAA